MKESVLIGMLAVAFAGCSTGAGQSGGGAELGEEGTSTAGSSAPTSVHQFVNSKGELFVEVTSLSYFQQLDQPWKGKSPEELSESELAQALRAVTRSKGRTYVQAQPAYELAHKIKTAAGPIGGRAFNPSGSTATQSGVAIPDSDVASKVSAIVNGTDNRTKQTSVWPHTAQIVISASTNYDGTGSNNCSGTLVARGTAISSASCQWNKSANNWYPTTVYAAGVVDRNFPFGDTTCANVTIPTAFITDSPAPQDFTSYDYAIIDFGACGNFIGDSTGWLGWVVASDSTIKNNIGLSFGYPLGSGRNWPSVWGMSGGSGSIQPGCFGTVGTGHSLNTTMDDTPGEKGMGWYINGTPPGFGAGLYVVGIDAGLAVGGSTGIQNCGRRLDQTLANFMCANSGDC